MGTPPAGAIAWNPPGGPAGPPGTPPGPWKGLGSCGGGCPRMKSGIGPFSAGTMGSGGPGPRELGGPLRFRGEAFRLVPGVPGKPPPGMPGSGGPGPRFDGVPGCDGPNDLGVPVFGVPLPPGVPKPGPGGPRPMEPGSSGAMVCFASSKTCGSGNACISWSAMDESGASPVPGSERIGS